jgi:Zn-dependent M28 family amino/carboxypeptidase
MLLLQILCAATATVAGCDKLKSSAPKTAFNGEAAMGYIKTQLDFGPRVPGTAAHRKTGDWIVAEMKKRTDSVIVQSWTHVTAKGDTLPLRNILARFNPSATQRVLYLTHWDTRPTADEDLNFGNKQRPFPGANDGASGVALLIALGDVFKQTPPSVGVDLLFVDGEDWGDFGLYSDSAKNPDVLIGSTYFATHLPIPGYKPLYGVLFDMIGDADLQIFQEENSVSAAPEVVSRVWNTATELGYGKYFIRQVWGPITDDHVPLIRKAGFRVIDVIDIQYGNVGPTPGPGDYPEPSANYHHTLLDTIDKVSAKSLQIVGDVAVTLVR